MPEGLHADVLGVFTLANISQANRFRGSLMGLAVGDAVGTTVEFMRPGTFEPVTDMVGGGPFYLKPGQWTDDTSLALCLAESLVQCGGFNAADQMSLYTMWYRTGYWSSTGRCFDIGNTTRESLHRWRAHPQAIPPATGRSCGSHRSHCSARSSHREHRVRAGRQTACSCHFGDRSSASCAEIQSCSGGRTRSVLLI